MPPTGGLPAKILTVQRIFAAADIGSNTAHLLVAATDGEIVMRIDNFNEWIPLGEVVARHREIPKELASNLVSAVKEFKRLANAKQAEQLYVFATEGMRMARNHAEIVQLIRRETGVSVEIISAKREAELSFLGVGLDSRNLRADVMFEVGGGSLQIGVIKDQKLSNQESLPLGTGRIIAESGLTSPCPTYAYEAAVRYIESTLDRSECIFDANFGVASGGVGRGLWRALHPDGEKVLAREEVEYMLWCTRRQPIERLVSRFNVKVKRAGTLLPGALIYASLMRRFDLDQLAISEFGLREGAILEMAKQK